MEFAPTYTLASAAFPGVVVTLKRMGPRRRAEVELSISAARARQRELSIRHESTRAKLIASIDASPKDAEGKPIEAELRADSLTFAMELQALQDEAAALKRAQIDPAFIRAALKSFGGPEQLTYEGKPATAEYLIEYGPDDLFQEVVDAISANAYLSAEASANLSSPSTSGAPVDGGQTPPSTTAPPASPAVSFLNGTAMLGIQTTLSSESGPSSAC